MNGAEVDGKILPMTLKIFPRAYNLNRPDYVSIVCGSLECLHEAFAKLDSEKNKNNTKNEENIKNTALPHVTQTETSSLPTENRRLVRTEHMKRRIVAAARGR